MLRDIRHDWNRSVVLALLLGVLFLGGGNSLAESGGSDALIWEQIFTSVAPSPRIASAMAPAPSDWGDGVILFGGSSSTLAPQDLSDTWHFTGSQWVKRGGATPGARSGHAMAQLPSGNVLMFGGQNRGELLGDTWLHDGNGWRPILGAAPDARAFHSMARCPELSGVILFGGRVTEDKGDLSSETWLFSEQAGWKQLHCDGPAPRWRHGMSYSAYEDHDLVGVILFGGDLSLRGTRPRQDTWWFHLEKGKPLWSRVALDKSPTPRLGHSIAEFEYSSIKKHVAVLFGGMTEARINQIPGVMEYKLWEFNTWGRLDPPIQPGWRSDFSMCWDPGNYALVLFGGIALDAGYETFGDTWIFREK